VSYWLTGGSVTRQSLDETRPDRRVQSRVIRVASHESTALHACMLPIQSLLYNISALISPCVVCLTPGAYCKLPYFIHVTACEDSEPTNHSDYDMCEVHKDTEAEAHAPRQLLLLLLLLVVVLLLWLLH